MHQLDLDIIDNCEPGRIRAPFSWYGGKKLLASWIISYLTPCKIYVEPFAGAANVFWHLPTGFYQMAVLNDIDERVVRVYRALQDPDKFEKLAHMLIWTPYSRAEYRRALEILSANNADEVEAAWALIVASVQGYSGWFKTDGNWSRSFSCDKPGAWHRRAGLLPVWREKLARAYIDNVDAMACIRYWDSADTLFYVDPPYVVDVRAEKYGYRYELDLAGHARLVQTLLEINGKAALSCYMHEVYQPLLDAGWKLIEKPVACNAVGRTRVSGLRGPGSARERCQRVECLLISPNMEVTDGKKVDSESNQETRCLAGVSGGEEGPEDTPGQTEEGCESAW